MKFKRWMAAFIAALMILLLGGCSLATVNEERDMQQVVATINGQPLKKIEMYALYEVYKSYYESQYGSLDGDDINSRAMLKQIKQDVVDRLVQNIVLLQKAKQEGYDQLSDEEIATVHEQFDSLVESNLGHYKKQYDDRVAKDPDFDADAAAMADLVAERAASGRTMESWRQSYLDDAYIAKMQTAYDEQVTVTDEEAKGQYDILLEAQKLAYDMEQDDTEATDKLNTWVEEGTLDAAPDFETDFNGGKTIVYYPDEKFVLVKQILVMIPEEERAAITAAQYDENGSQTDETKAASDKLYQEALAKIQDKADEVLEKIADGEAFDDLVEQYNEDTGMSSYMQQGGYLVGRDSGYVQPFIDGALGLKEEGDTTDLVESSYGYHILQLTRILPQGEEVPFEEVKDEIMTPMLTEMQTTRWSELLEQWMAEADIVLYEERW
ncbi:MAG: peptidylprolyl isomerase [Christensenellales bacterium]|jgi:peptidyl-prolyl cis-trans isomerase D